MVVERRRWVGIVCEGCHTVGWLVGRAWRKHFAAVDAGFAPDVRLGRAAAAAGGVPTCVLDVAATAVVI